MSANIINQDTAMAQVNTESSTMMSKLSRFVPPALYILAGIIMIVSISFPYWGMVLLAPQYPGGLEMNVYVNYMTGDEDPRLDEVREIDGLNHYIGMKSLYEAAQFERSIAIPGIIAMVVLLLVAAFWNKRWTWLLTLPALTFPAVFLGDLAFWMNHYGQNLDPYAPLSSAIKPFTPPVLGEGVIGQFKTVANVEIGWFMAVGAVVLVFIGLLIRFGVYLSHREQKG